MTSTVDRVHDVLGKRKRAKPDVEVEGVKRK